MNLGRRGKHLDKEREGRKKEEEQEHFKRHDKTKNESIKKDFKGKKGLKVTGDCERSMQCRSNEEAEGKREN